ncbi:MATE family efflux transporter [Planctomycetales bacterium ZRK34]|nr:MATE family efflux transporter [Planctomycetales bacterium ZRK34]
MSDRLRFGFDGGDVRELMKLAAPVVTVQLGMMLMNVVDSAMVGHYSAVDLAAVGMGSLYIWGISVVAIGVLMAFDPVVSQAFGAGDHVAMTRAAQRGMLLSFGLACASAVMAMPVEPFMNVMNQPPAIVPGVRSYVLINLAGLWPFYMFVVLRQMLQAADRLRPLVITIVLANLGNVVLNWAMVFGHLGSPELGLIGSAWATVISRWVMVIALLLTARRDLTGYLFTRTPGTFALRPLMRIIRLGLPIGISMALEFGAFATVAIFMGAFGERSLAAHQIALMLAALTFMVPLGISQAAAVLVGRAIGRGQADQARRSATASMLAAAGFMSGSAIVFMTMPTLLARCYTDDVDTIAMAAMLVPIAGLFQIFDGLQVAASGVLRGVGETRWPMYVQLVGLWLVGLPVSIGAGVFFGVGEVGLWWGFVAGIGASAALLCAGVWRRMRGPLDRLAIDEPTATSV